MSSKIERARVAATGGRSVPRRRIVVVAGPALAARLLSLADEVERRRRPVLRFVPSLRQLGDIAATARCDAALLDLTSPSSKTLDAVRGARMALPDIPLIVIVSDAEEELGRAALLLGAQDYLMECELAPRSVERSLRHASERYALQRALQGERADLAASRASMVGLIEGNADGLVVVDASGVARFANPAAESLFGLGEQEIIGQSLDLPLSAGGASEIELRMQDGSVRVAEVRIAPVSWDGEPAFLASLRDVTERKRVERTMRRSAESFRALAEAAPDPIVVHRGDAIVWANRAFARLLGAESHEAAQVGTVSSWLELSESADTDGLAGESVADPRPAVVRTRRGTVVPAEIRRYRILFDEADATLSLVHDVAAREQEARARAQHERLASLGRLAANLGHEINNPLSYVVSNLSYLGAHLADLGARLAAAPDMPAELDEARSAAADALEGAERVAAIVRDVRVLSRIESRELRQLRIPEVLESAVRIARGKLSEVAQVSLNLEDTPAVRANDTALLQVFVNLLVNAADACAELPSERHQVSVRCFGDADGCAVVEIRDTGAGISDDIRAHLFEPFFTTKEGGSGFGLAISFAIVESLAGTLTLESDGLRGAVARVVLPQAPAADAALRDRRGPSPRRSRPSGRAVRGRAARAGSVPGTAAPVEPS